MVDSKVFQLSQDKISMAFAVEYKPFLTKQIKAYTPDSSYIVCEVEDGLPGGAGLLCVLKDLEKPSYRFKGVILSKDGENYALLLSNLQVESNFITLYKKFSTAVEKRTLVSVEASGSFIPGFTFELSPKVKEELLSFLLSIPGVKIKASRDLDKKEGVIKTTDEDGKEVVSIDETAVIKVIKTLKRLTGALGPVICLFTGGFVQNLVNKELSDLKAFLYKRDEKLKS